MIVAVCYKVLRVGPQLFLQHCSLGLLLHSCFSREGAEVQNVLGGAVALSVMGSLWYVPAS